MVTLLLSGIVTILQSKETHQYEHFEDDAAAADAEAAAAEAAAKEQEVRIKQFYTALENLSAEQMRNIGTFGVAIYKDVLKRFDTLFAIDAVRNIMEQLKLYDMKKTIDILIPKYLEEMNDNYDDLCLLTTETKYLFVKLKTETNSLSDLDLPADELKRLTEDRKRKALLRYTEDKTRYSKQNGDKPIMECFANPDDQEKPDEDATEEEKAAAAEKKKAAADKDAKEKAAKLAASKAQAKKEPPKEAISEKDVDAYIAILNEAMASTLILEAKNKQTMIEATLGFNANYFKKLRELKPSAPAPKKKEGFENPILEGFQTVPRAKFLALKLLKSLQPVIDMLEKHYDLQNKIMLQKDELKKIKQSMQE